MKIKINDSIVSIQSSKYRTVLAYYPHTAMLLCNSKPYRLTTVSYCILQNSLCTAACMMHLLKHLTGTLSRNGIARWLIALHASTEYHIR